MQKLCLSWIDPLTGDPQKHVFALPLTLGRAPDNNLVLDSAVVSGYHARLRAEGAGIVLEDLKSRNGVSINGARVAGGVVAPGDAFTIGPFEMLLRYEASDVRVRLDWTDPQTQAPHSAVHRLPLAIGRDPGCEVVIADPRAAPRQVVIQDEGDQICVTDTTGAATVAVGGQWSPKAVLTTGAAVALGAYRFVLTVDSAARRRGAGESTIVFSDQLLTDVQKLQEQAPASSAWPPPIFRETRVPVPALAQYGLPVTEVDYLTVGAGLGGFIWVDNLLIRGVKPAQVMALGVDPSPYGRWRRLCKNSQIPDHERIRSNTDATPDCPWGYPGFAAREIWRGVRAGKLGESGRIFWQVFGEPALTQTYTPRADDVFRGIDQEARRIGWDKIMRYGRVRAVRLTADGRYVVAYSGQSPTGGSAHAFAVARHVLVATGYPALKFLPDLQRYREETEDFVSVVNAYEDHDHVYETLKQKGGIVVLRGRGIVASRVLQRLDECRKVNPRIGIVHALRTPLAEGHKWRKARRRVANHTELQPFNWPKACWGGDLRFLLERSTPEERKRLLTDWGGTTTADRTDWVDLVERGLREGWYQIVFGEVERVERSEHGRLDTMIRGRGQVGGLLKYEADFIVDATGLEAGLATNPLLDDLIKTYALKLNVVNRLDVANDFSVPGLANGAGRAFAAGAITMGGPFAPVDSFLGFQYMATVSLDALTRLGAPGLRRFGALRSMGQWVRWARGVAP